MASKRKLDDVHRYEKRHTLDSDEDDSDDYERDQLNDSDIEGGEDGIARTDGVKITPFNMTEELQEGHFDTDGHYHWDKNTEIQDNWLDYIDSVKVEDNKNSFNPNKDDSTDAPLDALYSLKTYQKILEFMEPQETIEMTLKRLGKQRPKLSSMERIRRKKAGTEDPYTIKIYQLTELANGILSKTGNMSVYQESYEQIKGKVKCIDGSSKKNEEKFDMYSDDFEEKEKQRLNAGNKDAANASDQNSLSWEFKRKQDDNDIEGPFSTEQMLKWSKEDYFKKGVYVRKVGEKTNFYSSNRIDFELYL